MTVGVYEDPAVVELVNAATLAVVAWSFGREVDWPRIHAALVNVPIPEEEEHG